MLNRMHFVGFSSGAVLACIYGWFGPSGCGTMLGTTPLFLAWGILAKLFGGVFADQHTWMLKAVAAVAHGVVLGSLCWLLDSVVRKFVSDQVAVRLTCLLVLITVYACLLFLAWPLRECP